MYVRTAASSVAGGTRRRPSTTTIDGDGDGDG